MVLVGLQYFVPLSVRPRSSVFDVSRWVLKNRHRQKSLRVEKCVLSVATGLILHPERTLSALSRGRKLRTAIKLLRSGKRRRSPRRSNCLQVARGKNLVRSVELRSTFARKFAPVGMHLPRCSGRTFAFSVFGRIVTCIKCGWCLSLRTDRFRMSVLSTNPMFATKGNVSGKTRRIFFVFQQCDGFLVFAYSLLRPYSNDKHCNARGASGRRGAWPGTLFRWRPRYVPRGIKIDTDPMKDDLYGKTTCMYKFRSKARVRSRIQKKPSGILISSKMDKQFLLAQ